MRGSTTAVVLAGERPGGSPLAEAGQVPCKALLPVGGRPMIHRVVDALSGSDHISHIVICGPRGALTQDPHVRQLIEAGKIEHLEPEPTPASSALAVFDRLANRSPILVTTADHVLLEPAILDAFLQQALSHPATAVAGVTRRQRVLAAYPDLKKTAIRLRDGDWCGCNLFLLKGPDARRAPEFWRALELHRKAPWRLASLVGWGFLVRYLSKSIDLTAATSALGRRMGIPVGAVELDRAEAAVDVDSVNDWKVLEQHLAKAPPAIPAP